MNKMFVLIVVLIVIFMGAGLFMLMDSTSDAFAKKDIEDKREEFIMEKDTIIAQMMADGKYKCCLETPCTYCIEKTPGHGDGAACNCLADVVNGKHPCGECIGEIMEGHGNKYLAEYFPVALADEMGEEHLEVLKLMLDEKYKTVDENKDIVCDKLNSTEIELSCGE